MIRIDCLTLILVGTTTRRLVFSHQLLHECHRTHGVVHPICAALLTRRVASEDGSVRRRSRPSTDPAGEPRRPPRLQQHEKQQRMECGWREAGSVGSTEEGSPRGQGGNVFRRPSSDRRPRPPPGAVVPEPPRVPRPRLDRWMVRAASRRKKEKKRKKRKNRLPRDGGRVSVGRVPRTAVHGFGRPSESTVNVPTRRRPTTNDIAPSVPPP